VADKALVLQRSYPACVDYGRRSTVSTKCRCCCPRPPGTSKEDVSGSVAVKGYYDLKVKGPEISKGDFVVYENKTNLRVGEICSLRLPYKTPLFQVARKLSNVNYEITPDGRQGPAKIVHFNQIKKVQGPGRVPGDEIPAVTSEAEQQPRRSGRARQCPEYLGTDARDPDVPWIP
jgi:hypothetical protein